jgi:hypothetical protein
MAGGLIIPIINPLIIILIILLILILIIVVMIIGGALTRATSSAAASGGLGVRGCPSLASEAAAISGRRSWPRATAAAPLSSTPPR